MTPAPAPIDPELLVRRLRFVGRGARELAAIAYLGPEWRFLGARHAAGGRATLAIPIRTVVHDALGFGAARVILAHGHPSGDPTPSGTDRAYTRLLARTLEAVGVTLHDHLVVAGTQTTSFRAMGLL